MRPALLAIACLATGCAARHADDGGGTQTVATRYRLPLGDDQPAVDLAVPAGWSVRDTRSAASEGLMNFYVCFESGERWRPAGALSPLPQTLGASLCAYWAPVSADPTPLEVGFESVYPPASVDAPAIATRAVRWERQESRTIHGMKAFVHEGGALSDAGGDLGEIENASLEAAGLRIRLAGWIPAGASAAQTRRATAQIRAAIAGIQISTLK